MNIKDLPTDERPRERMIEQGAAALTAYAVKEDGSVTPFTVSFGDLTGPERQILVDGCLINYYRNH